MFDPEAPWPRHGGDHPALGVYLLSLSGWLFGRNDVGYRMLNVIVGSLTVPLLAIAVTRFVSRWEAVAAGLLLAINPFHLALSSLAIEVPFQILFGTAALAFASRLPGGGRPALFGCAATLGLGFMCSESTALILVAWLGVALLDPARLAGLKARDFAVATGIGLVIVAQDLHYNLTADTADFYYVNYLDHLGRIGSSRSVCTDWASSFAMCSCSCKRFPAGSGWMIGASTWARASSSGRSCCSAGSARFAGVATRAGVC